MPHLGQRLWMRRFGHGCGHPRGLLVQFQQSCSSRGVPPGGLPSPLAFNRSRSFLLGLALGGGSSRPALAAAADACCSAALRAALRLACLPVPGAAGFLLFPVPPESPPMQRPIASVP